jgi:hypothetical protein
MNLYSTTLKFDLPLFKTNLTPVEFLKNHPLWEDSIKKNPNSMSHIKLDWQTNLSDQLNQFFLDHDLEIRLCEVLYKPPNAFSKIHIDGNDPSKNDLTKINWVIGGEDSKMVWYDIKDSYYAKPLSDSLVKTSTSYAAYAIVYIPEDVNEVYSENIRGPSLVQVGIPHNVITNSQARWCMSIIFRDLKLGRRPTMMEAREIFKQYLP